MTPVGSSRSAVESYLDSQSIQHSYIEDSKSPNERRVELALIRAHPNPSWCGVISKFVFSLTSLVGYSTTQSERYLSAHNVT